MRIAVIFDSISPESGGNFYQSLQSAKILNSIQKENKDFIFKFITFNKHSLNELNKNGMETALFKNIKLSKIYYLLNQSPVFKNILKFFKIKNPFKYYLEKNNFELVIFLNASWYIKLCDGINFIISSFDINFKLLNFFPEYLNQDIFISKEEIMRKSCNQAFKILVDTVESKKELVNFYRCPSEKISVQPFSSFLTNLNSVDLQKSKINKKILDIVKNQKFLFFPAQFWAHKNHRYIVEAIRILRDKYKLKINIIFCGKDKGNLDFVKKIVNENNLNNQIYFFDFLSEQEIIFLYKNCLALVNPTYVARSTLLLYEAFYFKVPVFYSENVLDGTLEEYVEVFDLNDFENLACKLNKFINGKIDFTQKIEAASEYFAINCHKNKISENYLKVINEYKFFRSIWKN